jgi:hypothetical protein
VVVEVVIINQVLLVLVVLEVVVLVHKFCCWN